jgi:hypothetical protein
MKFLNNHAQVSFLQDVLCSQLVSDRAVMEQAINDFAAEYPAVFERMRVEETTSDAQIRFICMDVNNIAQHQAWFTERNLVPLVTDGAAFCTLHGDLLIFKFPDNHVFTARLSDNRLYYSGSMEPLAEYLELEIDYAQYIDWEDKIDAALLPHGIKIKRWYTSEGDDFGPMVRYAAFLITVDHVEYLVRFYYG